MSCVQDCSCRDIYWVFQPTTRPQHSARNIRCDTVLHSDAIIARAPRLVETETAVGSITFCCRRPFRLDHTHTRTLGIYLEVAARISPC